MRRRGLAALVGLAVVLTMAGCPFLRGAPPPTAPPPAPPGASGLSISALPAYRLVADPALIDAPSRLLVLHVRLETSDERPSTVWPENSLLTLPGGEQGRVFDRGRAMELLRRTTLADANLAYLQQAEGYPAGGLDAANRAQLIETIMANLLSEGALTKAAGVQGYVVADVGTPMSSLHGATLDYWAYPLDDSQPVHARYAFGGAEAVAAAAATATPAVAGAAAPAAASPAPATLPVPVDYTAAPAAATPAPTVRYLFELAEPAEETPSPAVAPAAAAVDAPAPAAEAAQPGAETPPAAVDAAIEPAVTPAAPVDASAPASDGTAPGTETPAAVVDAPTATAVTPAPPVDAAPPASDGSAPVFDTPAVAVESAAPFVPTATPLPLETPSP